MTEEAVGGGAPKPETSPAASARAATIARSVLVVLSGPIILQFPLEHPTYP